MKGSFNAPFFYAELHPEIDRKINLKLARILRRWQLGVACLDTSRLAALAEDKPRLNLTEPTEISENESVPKAVFAANPLGESPLFFGYDIFSFLVRIFRCGFLFNYFFAFALLLLCSLRPYSSLRPNR